MEYGWTSARTRACHGRSRLRDPCDPAPSPRSQIRMIILLDENFPLRLYTRLQKENLLCFNGLNGASFDTAALPPTQDIRPSRVTAVRGRVSREAIERLEHLERAGAKRYHRHRAPLTRANLNLQRKSSLSPFIVQHHLDVTKSTTKIAAKLLGEQDCQEVKA
jgi:hypothetical protein